MGRKSRKEPVSAFSKQTFCALKNIVSAKREAGKKPPAKSHYGAQKGILISFNFGYFLKIRFLNGFFLIEDIFAENALRDPFNGIRFFREKF
jgi:hypothetical protein